MEIIAPSVPHSAATKAFTLLRFLILAAAVCAEVACATRAARPLTAPPMYLELRSSPAVATVHFPPGVYVLESSEPEGFFYRAPRQLSKHSFGGAQPYNGGVFVSRRDPRKLRGYIVWAGGRTKIGDLSNEPHSFRE